MQAIGPTCRKRENFYKGTIFWSNKWAGVKPAYCNLEDTDPMTHEASFEVFKRQKQSSIHVILEPFIKAWKCVLGTKKAKVDVKLPNPARKESLDNSFKQLSASHEPPRRLQRAVATLWAEKPYFVAIVYVLFKLCNLWEADIHQKSDFLLEWISKRIRKVLYLC